MQFFYLTAVTGPACSQGALDPLIVLFLFFFIYLDLMYLDIPDCSEETPETLCTLSFTYRIFLYTSEGFPSHAP